MNEAKDIWIKADVEKKEQVKTLLQEEFGKPIKFSEILPEQRDRLEAVLTKLITD